MTKVKRGDVFLANLSDATGSEQAFVRPVVIIQNNCGNKHSPTTIVACLS
ncbi:type II toxin-antitoxin system PemK/MazF family toxin, partial [Erysipelatoclostridium ramosum]